MKTISVGQLHQISKEGTVCILDVRTPAEFRGVHITGARLEPLDSFDPVQIAARYEQRPLYLVCHAGSRSQKAAGLLEQAGITDVISVDGGTRAWEAEGFPVTRGRGVISIDRQVRIAAGGMVLLGVVISLFLHPGGIYLSGLVGAGLMFAGITDTCGLALVLARMPWNRGQAPGCSV